MATSKGQDSRRLTAYKKAMGQTPEAIPAPETIATTKPLPSALAIDPVKAAGLLKTTTTDNYRKMAKLLILIGKSAAAKILAQLDEAQVEKLSQEIVSIQTINDQEAAVLLEEFHSRLAAGMTASGGVEAARAVLSAAFGQESGEALLKKVLPEVAGRPFDFLEDLEGDQIALLLANEVPVTIALVLSRLSPQKAAAVIANWKGAHRLEILKRMAKLNKVAPETLERVAAALRDKARAIGRSDDTERLDGKAALAEILKRSSAVIGDRLLGELSDQDPELGRELKERIYSLDDIVRMEDRVLQERLRAMTNQDLALLLKGLSPAASAKLLANLSTIRRKTVQEEREILGAVPRHDVEAVIDDFMTWFRQGRDSGKIILIDEDELVE